MCCTGHFQLAEDKPQFSKRRKLLTNVTSIIIIIIICWDNRYFGDQLVIGYYNVLLHLSLLIAYVYIILTYSNNFSPQASNQPCRHACDTNTTPSNHLQLPSTTSQTLTNL